MKKSIPEVEAARIAIRDLEGKLCGIMASYIEQMEALEWIAIGEHAGGKPLSADEMRAIARGVFFKTEQ